MEKEATVILWREDDKIVALEPSSGVASQGKTLEEAIKNISEALALYVEEKGDIKPVEQVVIMKVRIARK